MFTVDIDSAAIDRAMATLLQRTVDVRPLLLEIGEELADSTQKRFDSTTAPDGSLWERNSEVTLARKSGNKPLTNYGTLHQSIHYQLLGGEAVLVGSNLDYAAMMQFGGTKADFPHLWGDIPARPFLGLSSDDEQTVLDLIADYLL